jgi:hypothetical protein
MPPHLSASIAAVTNTVFSEKGLPIPSIRPSGMLKSEPEYFGSKEFRVLMEHYLNTGLLLDFDDIGQRTGEPMV